MSLPFDNALQREVERVRRQREGGQHTDLSDRMDTPTFSPAGLGTPPSIDLSTMTDMVTELSQPVDRAQLNQEIEDFNLSYPVNVDDALNLCNLPPVAGTGTAPTTTTTAPPPPPPPITTIAPITTAPPTRPTTSTRTRPTTRPVTSTRTRPVTTATTTTAPTRPLTVRRRAGAGTRTTTSTVTAPRGRPTVAAKQPRRRRPRAPSPPSPDGSPPPSDDDEGDDGEDDRRRGLRRQLDLLKEDAQQRARGRRIRNITHTNTVTTVYEDRGGRPSVRLTSTRTSSPSPPPSPPRRGRGRARGRGRRS